MRQDMVLIGGEFETCDGEESFNVIEIYETESDFT